MTKARSRAFVLALAFSAVMTLVGQAQAGLSLVTSPADLNANDSVDWGVLGSTFTDVSNPFTVNSGGGVGLTVSQASGDFQLRQQGNGWSGNFNPGDNVLWTQGGGPMTIMFSQALQGVGAQIQTDYYGAFTAQITVLDSLGNPIASFTEAGNSNSNGDGSAIFLGVTGGGIYGITYSMVSGNQLGDFAINTLGLNTQSVPEPSTFVLGVIEALGVFGVARGRKHRVAG